MFIKLWYVDPYINQYNLLYHGLQQWIELIDKYNDIEGQSWDYEFFQLLIMGDIEQAADLTHKHCNNRGLQVVPIYMPIF